LLVDFTHKTTRFVIQRRVLKDFRFESTSRGYLKRQYFSTHQLKDFEVIGSFDLFYLVHDLTPLQLLFMELGSKQY